MALSWEGRAEKYAVYRAVDVESKYCLLGYTEKTQFMDMEYSQVRKSRLAYRVTALTKENLQESTGVNVFLSSL